MKKIFAVQETTYVNEWLGMLPDYRVASLFLRENKKLLAIRSYSSYPEDHVKKIYLPFAVRGKKVAAVGPLDHILYTLSCFLLLPLMLFYDAVIFVVPTFLTTSIMPVLKLFGKKIYVISLDPQDVLLETYKKNRKPHVWIYVKISCFLEKLAMRSATKIFTVSNYLKNQYSKYNQNIYVTPNGADTRRIEKIEKKKMFNGFTIAYFGSLDTWRGVDMLADAFVKLRNSRAGKKARVKLLLLGGGPEEENIRKRFANDKDVYVSGFIDHSTAISYCKAADVLVAPFRETPVLRRTFSIKPSEYVACGVPVVVTDTVEHAEFIKRLEAGLIVAPDVDNLSEALETLIRDQKLYKKLKDNCVKNRSNVDYTIMRKPFSDEINEDLRVS